MKNSVVMAVGYAATELIQERFQNPELQPAFAAIKILLQVKIQKLKHQRQLLFRVHNIIQSASQAKLEDIRWLPSEMPSARRLLRCRESHNAARAYVAGRLLRT